MLNKISVKVSLFLGMLIIIGYNYWFFVCKRGNCSFEFRNGILDPFMSGMFGLLFSFILLMFFSDKVFIKWIKFIASWYIPLAIFFVSSVNIYSGFILNIPRPEAALFWMAGLFILTIVFLLLQRFYFKVK